MRVVFMHVSQIGSVKKMNLEEGSVSRLHTLQRKGSIRTRLSTDSLKACRRIGKPRNA